MVGCMKRPGALPLGVVLVHMCALGPTKLCQVCAWYRSWCCELCFASAGLACPPGGLANSQLAPSWSDHPVAREHGQLVLGASQPAPSPAFSIFLTGHSGTLGHHPNAV